MFNLHQNILLIDESQNGTIGKKVALSTLDSLSADIAAMCVKYNVSQVKLQGNKEYASELVKEIYTIANKNYGLNNIEVEVI
jgi:hypothetical protein